MGKQKNSKDLAKREAKIKAQPTVYTFDFADVPLDKYAEALSVLFHNPDFAEAVAKRNRLVKTADRMTDQNALSNLARTIEQHDRRLADMLYAYIVQVNIKSDVTYDFLSFSTLLRYYVDYSREGMPEAVDRLAADLDRVTFMADMIESLITDVKSEMRTVFGNEVEFQQFDAVSQVLTQLRGFFSKVRSNDGASKEAQLYMEYADSINDYLGKRLETYTRKYRKLAPMPPVYTADDMVDAINQFFGTDGQFGKEYIAHTASGGSFINALKLLSDITQEQCKKFEECRGEQNIKVSADNPSGDFAFTNLIMKHYRKKK